MVDVMELPETSDITPVIEKTQIKHYLCEKCNKSFRDSSRLKRHERFHVKAGIFPVLTDFSLQEEELVDKKIDIENLDPINEDIEQKGVDQLNEPWSETFNIMKKENPWDITSIFDLAFFCCPECDSKSQSKQDFISHALKNHPWVSFHVKLPSV